MTDIAVSNLQKKIPVRIPVVSANIRKTIKALKFFPPFLSIAFVGEKRMRRLNREYLGHDHVTDVITFDHGEVIVCPAMARRNAKRFGNLVGREIMLCVVHGILHLCGYDDQAPADIERMRRKERQIMDLLS